MRKWQKAAITGVFGGMVGAMLGALTAMSVARGKLDFGAAAPGVFLLELTNINTAVSQGASRPTVDILLPANAAAYALFFASIGILLYLRRANAAKAPRYPEGLSQGLALTITMCCFPLFFIASGLAFLFIIGFIAGSEPGPFIIVGDFVLNLAIAAAFILAYFLANSLYSQLRWKKRAGDYPCCTNCGYNMTGNVSGICPECGQPTSCPNCGHDLTGNVSGVCPECGAAIEKK